ncbi:MAG TPA: tetratricopeptide repeat protein, partial [Pirellulaceae bacterium]|nr:tetratricopeptide repeat protein [Pirellulaceae bacterium]
MALAGPAEDDYAIAAEHYSQQRYPAATTEFRKFLRNHRSHVLAANSQFFLAESLHQQGDYAAAGEEFAHFTADYPEHRFAAQAGFRQGETAYLQGLYSAARPKLAGFVAAHPRDKLCEFAWPYLGDIELELGDFAAAQKAYGQALKSYPAGPLAAECRLGLGRAAEALNDPEEARRFYQFLADRDEHELSREAQLRLGRLLFQTRDFAEASNYLRPLAESKAALPQRTPARYWLGQMLNAQGKRDDACKVWRQAVEQDAEHPLAPTVCLAWADALRTGGDFKTASEQYQRLVKSWPQSDAADDALLAQLELAIDAKQWTDADTLAQQFERTYATSPLQANVQAAQAYGWLQQARFAEAMVVLKELSRADSPRRLQQLYWLALAQLGAKEYTAALETITSIKSEKLSAEVQAGILATEGIALVALKRPEEALVPLNKYIGQHPQGADLPRCRAQHCIALVQLGRFDAATAAWRDYVKAHAQHPALLPTTLYMAEAAYGARQNATARELFEWLAQEQQPAEYRTQANTALAWLEQSANEPAKSVAKLDRVLNDRP